MVNSFKRAIIIVIIIMIVLLVALGATCAIYFNNTSRNDNVFVEILQQRIEYANGISIDGVNVSGLTIEEARPLVSAVKPDPLGKVTIQYGEKTTQLDLSSLMPERDPEPVLQKAILLGNDGNRATREAEQERILANGGEAFLTPLHYDLSPLRTQVERVATELSIDPVDASMRVLTAEELEAKRAAKGQQEENNAPENDASEAVNDMFEYIDAVSGEKVNADALFNVIQQSIDNGTLDQTVTVTETTPVPAEKSLEDIRATFVLSSTATSSFAAGNYSAPNRVFNITKAAGIMNGYILQPGETFSCNEVFGPRKTSTGWKEAGAISEGQSVQEVGGGICQVSSTLFNAVLLADLEIVDRQPHSWPLSYLPAGQDATISTGGPDFVFKNNRDTIVVLVASVDEKKKTITCQFYGEPVEDGMEIKLVSKKISSTGQPATQYSTVSSMAPNTSRTVRQGRSGSTYTTQIEYYKDGALVKTKSYNSKYRAIAAVVERGPVVAVAATPVPQSSNAGDSGNSSAAVDGSDLEIFDDIPEE